MQQWLVEDAVGRSPSPEIAVQTPGGTVQSLLGSTASDPLFGLLQTPGVENIGAMIVAALVLLVLGLGAVAAWHSDVWDRLIGSSGQAESGRAEPDGPTTTEQPPEPDAAAEAPPQPEPEAKTDQERIVDILEANEGRMKQAKIVDETGWSKSKVSMLLSEMEDDGDISKLRVGRENIISLSGNEPEAAGSPFDDE